MKADYFQRNDQDLFERENEWGILPPIEAPDYGFPEASETGI
jgi:hypothetical protein